MMFLQAIQQRYLRELTLAGLVLTGGVGAAVHWLWPDKSCLGFMTIPVFFWCVGLLYIFLFSCCYRLGTGKLMSCYMVCKALKFLLSVALLLAYIWVVKVDVVAFLFTFGLFFFGFLVFETRFFLLFEAKLKNRKKNE